MDVVNLIKENWIIVAAVLVLIGPNAFSFLKDKLSNIKLPSFKKSDVTTQDSPDTVTKDIEAIRWLANRAVDAGDQDLILELENVNKKFYNIHCSMRKSATSTN